MMKNISDETLQEITRRISERIKPEKIILFGSRAWGVPEEASDIDLCIIVGDSDQPQYRRVRTVYESLRGIGVPVDVIVQTREEVERSMRVVTSFVRRIVEQGKVLDAVCSSLSISRRYLGTLPRGCRGCSEAGEGGHCVHQRKNTRGDMI